MAFGLLAIALMSYFVVHRPPPPTFTAPRADSASSASATGSATTASPDPSRVLVVGDGLTADPAAWPVLVVADRQGGDRPVELDVAAVDGCGYARPGPGSATFGSLVDGAGTGFDVVVFFGSQRDNAAAPDVQSAAEAAFRSVARASPEATVLAIGPAWGPSPPGYIVTNRDAVGAAAEAAGVTFVDPLAEGWFDGADGALLGPDSRQPTEAGHRLLADRIGPLLDEALARGR